MSDTPESAIGATPSGEVSAAGPGGRRRRLVLVGLVAGLVLILVVAAVLGARVSGWWPDGAAEVAVLSPTPSSSAGPSPFAGTPAEEFAEGAAGIVLPEAEPVGDFTAEEVADALAQVRQALIAARLDDAMLIDHDPDPFLSLLAPDHQSGRLAEFDSGDFASYATQFINGTALVQAPPRVNGKIFYSVGTAGAQNAEVLEVQTSFVWVYAVERPAAEVPAYGLVVIRDEQVWSVRLGTPWLESSVGLWLSASRSYALGVECESDDRGLLHASTPGGTVAASVFSIDSSMPSRGGC